MISKQMTLLYASLLLLTFCLTALAQQASSTTATPQSAQSSTSVAVATNGSNYLGVATQEVTRENMSRYGLPEPRGLIILRVSNDSPAARAGLKAGDAILKFDGEQVNTFSKLQRLINEASPEQTVRLTISRDGREQDVSVTLGRRSFSFPDIVNVYPRAQMGDDARRRLEELQRNQGVWSFGWGRRIGISTTQLTKQLADYFGVAGGRGLLVTSVTENSPAARAGLKAGDVIMAADGEKIESSTDLSRAINRKNEGAVNLTIMRERNQMTLPVVPEKREPGAFSISPELLQIEPGTFEFSFPNIEIRMPDLKNMPELKNLPALKNLPELKNMKPITIPRIQIKPIKIDPIKLQKLELLMDLNDTL